MSDKETTEEGVGVDIESVEPFHFLLHSMCMVLSHVFVGNMANKFYSQNNEISNSKWYLQVDATQNPTRNQSIIKL